MVGNSVLIPNCRHSVPQKSGYKSSGSSISSIPKKGKRVIFNSNDVSSENTATSPSVERSYG